MKKSAAAKAENRTGRKRSRLIGTVAAAGIAAEHRGLERYIVARLHAHTNAGVRQRIGRSRSRQVGGEKGRPADAVVDEVSRSLALQELAIRQHQAGADGPAIVRRLVLVPERVEPRDRSGLEIRHCQNVAEIIRTNERTMGDEPVDMDWVTLPPCNAFASRDRLVL